MEGQTGQAGGWKHRVRSKQRDVAHYKVEGLRNVAHGKTKGERMYTVHIAYDKAKGERMYI